MMKLLTIFRINYMLKQISFKPYTLYSIHYQLEKSETKTLENNQN